MAVKFEAGDKIVFGRCKANRELVDITVGKIYKLHGGSEVFDGKYPYFLDDTSYGTYNGIHPDFPGKATKIID